MQTFHSEHTKQRRALTELDGGRLVTPYECPERVEMIIECVRESGLGFDTRLFVHDDLQMSRYRLESRRKSDTSCNRKALGSAAVLSAIG